MTTNDERKVAVKLMIEENPGIHHTHLRDMIVDEGIGARKTADRMIRQLLEGGAIVSFRAKRKKCYMLAADEAYKGDLVAMFGRRVEAIKKQLDGKAEEMPGHSYVAQLHRYESLCGGMEEMIADSDRWAKQLDKEQKYDHGEIGSSLRKLLSDTKIDSERRHRVFAYSKRVVSELESLGREADEKSKRKRALRTSAEKERLSDEIKGISARMEVLCDDALHLEHELKNLQSRDINYWYGDGDIGDRCHYLGSAREDSAKNAERMSSVLQELKEIAAKRAIPISTGRLDKQISETKKSLETMEAAIKEIETTGVQHEFVERLDVALSKAESRL